MMDDHPDVRLVSYQILTPESKDSDMLEDALKRRKIETPLYNLYTLFPYLVVRTVDFCVGQHGGEPKETGGMDR